MRFNFVIKFREGQLNTMVDALSRAIHMEELVVTSICQPQLLGFDYIPQVLLQEPKLTTILEELANGFTTHPQFHLYHGMFWYNNRLILSSSSIEITILLREAHDSLVGGYDRFLHMYKRLSQ